MKTSAPKRVHGEAFLLFILSFAVFVAAYYAAYKIGYYRLHLLAADLPLLKSGFDSNGLNTIIKIKALSPMVGVGLGIANALLIYFGLLVCSGWRRRSHFAGVFASILGMLPLAVLAGVLCAEQPNTSMISSVRAYMAIPASIALASTLLMHIFWHGGRRLFANRQALVALAALPLLSGCSFGDLAGIACEYSSDPDHCYQLAAIESGSAADCEKIAGAGFVGQNPPKDKCYLSVAANTGNYETCSKIEGGLTSYTQEECIKEVAIATQDKTKCEALNAAGEQLDCAALIPEQGDNPLKSDETPAAKITQVKGDVRIIKQDGRVIPVTKDSVLGPTDTISALEQSSFMIDFDGKKSFCIPQNTMISVNDQKQLDNSCAAATGVR